MSASKLIGSRVDQLDAQELDEQLFTVFKDQLGSAFKYLDGGNFLSFWSLEIDALIKAALLSVLLLHERPSTVGQSLVDLSLTAGNAKPLQRWKVGSVFLLLAGTRWFRERCLVSAINLIVKDRIRAERYATITDAVLRIAGVVNFYVFLTQSRYPNLLYRLFGISMNYSGVPSVRPVDYDAMSRELLWTSFAEFLAFLLPIINSSKSRSVVRNTLRQLYGKRNAMKGSSITERSITDYRTCAICSKMPVQPHEIGCRHVYCYFCVASNVLSDERFECPKCGQEAEGIRSVVPAKLV